MNIRRAPFAVRVVRRRGGDAAILYRRSLNGDGRERLTRIGALSPLAFMSGGALVRAAVRAVAGAGTRPNPGPFYPLDPDWGARVACYSLVCSGLRSAERLHRAAANLHHADATEAAWWYGVMAGRTSRSGKRAVRALRILVEAVR